MNDSPNDADPQLINMKKVTPSMNSSLQTIHTSLQCPLCNQLMVDPSTLACSHNFCFSCISNYDSWVCPFKGCQIPVSNRGKSRSYISLNPQLCSVVNSLNNILSALESSTDGWWKTNPYPSDGCVNSSLVSDHGERRKSVEFLIRKPLSDIEVGDAKFSTNIKQNIEEVDKECDGKKDDGIGLKRKFPSQVFDLFGMTSSSSPIVKDDDNSCNDLRKECRSSNKHQNTCNDTREKCSADTRKCCRFDNVEVLHEGEEEEENVSDMISITTDAFDITNTNDSLEGDGEYNCSNLLSSPDVSPIAVVSSQDFRNNDDCNIQLSSHQPSFSAEIPSISEETFHTKKKEKKKIDNIKVTVDKLLQGASSPLLTYQERNLKQNIQLNQQNSAPMIFFLSDNLKSTDIQCMCKFLKNGVFQMLHYSESTSNQNNSSTLTDTNWNKSSLDFDFDFEKGSCIDSYVSSVFGRSQAEGEKCYAVCYNSEFETCDGFIAPRSFRYLLAVASGLPIMDISFIRDLNNNSTYPSVNSAENRKSKVRGKKLGSSTSLNNNNKIYDIIGDVESNQWMGPKRSRKARLELYASIYNNLPMKKDVLMSSVLSNGLLKKFKVILCGKFDIIPSRLARCTLPRSSQRNSSINKGHKVDDSNLYSLRRVHLLLQLCGASVSELSEYTPTRDSGNEELIMIRKCPNARDRKLAAKLVSNCNLLKYFPNSIPIISSNWLLDSIAEFEIQNIKKYLQ